MHHNGITMKKEWKDNTDLALRLDGFYSRVKTDPRLGPTHIAMYVLLLYKGSKSDFQHPVCLKRQTIMKECRIYSRQTYSKVLHELHRCGYIIYQPRQNHPEGSFVYFCDSMVSRKLSSLV